MNSMKARKYSTSRVTGVFFTILAVLQLSIVIFSRPLVDMNPIIVMASASILFVCLSMIFGTYVALGTNALTRVDTFFLKQRLLFGEIDSVRYQPTYGVGKEASSLYIFRKNQDTAVITMTGLWFGEKILSQVVQDLKKANPTIILDQEAQELARKYESAG